MERNTPGEMQRPNITKDTRTLIRLKHCLAAGEEVKALMPDSFGEFEDALERGGLEELRPRLTVGENLA